MLKKALFHPNGIPMEATINFHIALSLAELADLIKEQLSAQECLKLVQLITDEPSPSEEEDNSLIEIHP